MMPGKIDKFTLLRVAMRSHGMMSVWNFQRMLNIGFLTSILPALKKIYSSTEEMKDVLQRHNRFFNTHPYFVSYILGLIVRKEELKANPDLNKNSNAISADTIESMKSSFMGPLGALGDSFFWGTLRPFLGLVAVFIIFIIHSQSNWAILGPIFFLMIYNLAHEYIRIGGVFVGYQQGEQMIQVIHQLNLQQLIDKIRNLGIFLAGTLMGITLLVGPGQSISPGRDNYLDGLFRFGIFILLTFLFCYGLHKKITSTRLFFAGLCVLWICDLIQRGF